VQIGEGGIAIRWGISITGGEHGGAAIITANGEQGISELELAPALNISYYAVLLRLRVESYLATKKDFEPG
jgi:hypothetical protein